MKHALVIDQFLYDLMIGKVTLAERSDRIAKFLAVAAFGNIYDENESLAKRPKWIYLRLRFGNTGMPFVISSKIAARLYPEELENEYVKREVEHKMQSFQPKWTETVGSKTWNLLPRYQSYDEMKKWEEQEAREIYRKGKVFEDNYSAILEDLRLVRKGPGREKTPRGGQSRLPDLPARILTKTECAQIEALCQEYVSEKMLDNIEKMLRFCTELAKPINHVRVRSGHYVDKPVNTRTVADMTNEAAHELSRLPKYTAFTKIIEESAGRQEVSVRRMETVPLPALDYSPHAHAMRHITRKFLLEKAGAEGICRPRSVIEEEIRQRRDRWRGGGASMSPQDDPPPTHFRPV